MPGEPSEIDKDAGGCSSGGSAIPNTRLGAVSIKKIRESSSVLVARQRAPLPLKHIEKIEEV